MTSFAFQKAVPIWAANRQQEMNCELAFRTSIHGSDATVFLAASSLYRLWVNGNFAGAGPARAAHGFYRVDEISLKPYLQPGENTVVIEVVAYNVNSYDTLDQPGFLTAEIIQNGTILAATGDASFAAYELQQRVPRVQRYSFQRAFTDVYRMTAALQPFYTGSDVAAPIETVVQTGKTYITREVPKPSFTTLSAQEVVQTGKICFDAPCDHLFRDRSYTDIGPELKGYHISQLQEHLTDEVQQFSWTPDAAPRATCAHAFLSDSYATYRFSHNCTGFVSLTAHCDQPCTLYLLFDEILSDGDVDFLRLTNCNCLKYTLDAGTHTITSFAPYTMMYLKIAAKGSCNLSQVHIIAYQQAVPDLSFAPSDSGLRLICDAAVQTYCQNALDIFMDCPSRERAGWLCDSFFTARTEYALTGNSALERVFLENFLLPQKFDHLPEGMLPMCYPADHYNGNFIPNWAMWFVLELEEYLGRSGDSELISRAKDRVFSLLHYLERFENRDGLLERLPGWIFVEWSRANDWVQDINFPSNMIYARMLLSVAKLYHQPALAEKSRQLMTTIRQRSYNGQFFTDHEIIENGRPVNPGHCSEVCQYYAFFTGVADPQRDPALWETLVRDFGPTRPADVYPDVAPANAFIGDYLRLELLYLDGNHQKLLDDLKAYFLPMASQTGTLWENNTPSASCCHGFASYVLYWLKQLSETHASTGQV